MYPEIVVPWNDNLVAREIPIQMEEPFSAGRVLAYVPQMDNEVGGNAAKMVGLVLEGFDPPAMIADVGVTYYRDSHRRP